jgi:hypothetical protein
LRNVNGWVKAESSSIRTFYYFLDTGKKPRKENPLGTEYVAALTR